MKYTIEPQVAGTLGDSTEYDATTEPPTVGHVEYVLDSPNVDDLVKSAVVFLVTPRLAEAIVRARLTGVSFSHDVSLSLGDFYVGVYGSVSPPKLVRLCIEGAEGDDFSLAVDHRTMVVSSRARELLRHFKLDGAIVTEGSEPRKSRLLPPLP